MPELVTLTDFKEHLGDFSSMDFAALSDADDYLTALLDRVEDLLERETEREFHATGTRADEPHGGSGTGFLRVDRPIATLTKVLEGYDPNDPDKTLDQVPDEVQADGRRVIRRDGGVFKRGIRNYYVTYDHAAFKPEVAQAALLEGAAYILRRRGTEHAASRSVGDFGNVQYAALFDNLPMWQRAVRELKPMVYA